MVVPAAGALAPRNGPCTSNVVPIPGPPGPHDRDDRYSRSPPGLKEMPAISVISAGWSGRRSSGATWRSALMTTTSMLPPSSAT